MKIKLQSTADQLTIYRETLAVVIYGVSLSACCILFGIVFLYLSDGELFANFISGVFILAGFALLIGIPRYYQRMKNDGGAILLNANMEGLNIAPILNMKPISYKWSDVNKILITKKYVIKEVNEKKYSWNIIIIYLKSKEKFGAIDRAKLQVWKSPKGNNISIIHSPKERMEHICRKLRELSKHTLEINTYDKIIFDHIRNHEIYEP